MKLSAFLHSPAISVRAFLLIGVLIVNVFSIISFEPANALADFNIDAAGDWGCSSPAKSTVTNMKGKSPEKVLGLGDYSYSNTATCWLDVIKDIKSITSIAIGNHEDDDGEGYSQYKSAFGFSNPYYSFNYQNVHILAMDTDRTSFSSGSAQYNFVINDLQSASQNPNINWIIVYLHKPFFTSPNSCDSSGCTNSGSVATNLRNTYEAKFDQFGVDLVLQGHVHNYQRTFPLKYNSGSPSNPTKTSSNTNDYTDPVGAIYAIVGTGGVNFHPLSGKSSFVAKQQDDDFGQLDIKITNNGAKLEGRFYPNGGGSVQDSFSITKVIGNSPPVANSQSVSTVKNTPVGITLIATDPNNDPLTYSIVTQPAHGTITAGTTASRTYTPATDYTGPDSFTFKANDGTVDSNIATVSIAVNNPGSGGYNYAPGFTATGSNYFDVTSTSSLQLSQFSVATWFKTSTDFSSEAFIVNKGGIGSDSAGQNQNYQISVSSTEQIKVGFETATGADFFVTSPTKYNDNQWHYAVVTYDGSSNLILYIDGVQVASKSTGGAAPETSGTKPVRVGANSRVTPPSNFFTGEIDEVRVWKDDLTPTEVTNAFTGTNFNTADQVLYLDFTNVQSGLTGGYTYGPSLTLSGP